MQELTTSLVGIFCLALFLLSYVAIALEDKIGVNKSKPALFVGTFMFFVLGVYFLSQGSVPHSLESMVEHVIVEIAGIFFFLYAAMTYIEALIERGVFDALKAKLLKKELSYKKLLWVTGFLTFFISAVADNLTAALVFATLLITIERENKNFLVPGAINVVVASNAGGAWSPFGDITTLMIWNAGKAPFFDFFYLFPASFAGWVLTCFLLSLYVPKGSVEHATQQNTSYLKPGATGIVWLGFFTIAVSVFAHQALHLPAIIGMMFGLSLLMIYSYNLKRKNNVDIEVFKSISRIENDTLLFFFGLMLAVGALTYIGYLALVADIYKVVDPVIVNIAVGFLSAVVDNVPLTYAILKANPSIDITQWLLVALTAGCGGSMIAFGSAAGVGVMGKMRGIYTFGSHMRYAWIVVVGFLTSVAVWFVQFEVIGIY